MKIKSSTAILQEKKEVLKEVIQAARKCTWKPGSSQRKKRAPE